MVPFSTTITPVSSTIYWKINTLSKPLNRSWTRSINDVLIQRLEERLEESTLNSVKRFYPLYTLPSFDAKKTQLTTNTAMAVLCWVNGLFYIWTPNLITITSIQRSRRRRQPKVSVGIGLGSAALILAFHLLIPSIKHIHVVAIGALVETMEGVLGFEFLV